MTTNHDAAGPAASKQPVLMLHCSASSGGQWDGLIGALAERYLAIAPDLHGYGASEPWSGPGPIELTAEAELAGRALPGDAAAVHVVGHSYGGAVALRFAIEQPWRIKSLTLIEPVAFHVLREGNPKDRRLLGSVHRIAAEVIRGTLTGDYHGAMSRFVDYWNGPGSWERTRPETRQYLSRHAPKVVLDFHASINERTSLDSYRGHFTFPVRILRGELSPAPTRRVAEMLSERILGASLMTIPRAGHMLPFTHADQVNAAVITHIDGTQMDGRRAA
jgi:pimeloyl-ACP methyl ester carboxylesterase